MSERRYSPTVPVKRASKLKCSLYLRNTRGSFLVVATRRVNARLYEVATADGRKYALDPKHPLWRRP